MCFLLIKEMQMQLFAPTLFQSRGPPFAPLNSEILEERKKHILMTHDTATNSDDVDETEQFKHELSSNLEQLRPAIKDTVCCNYHDFFHP